MPRCRKYSHLICFFVICTACFTFSLPKVNAQTVLQIDSIGQDLNAFTEGLVRQAEDPGLQLPFADFRAMVSEPFSSLPAIVQLSERIGFYRARETEVQAQWYPQVSVSAGGQETSYDTRSSSRSESASLGVSQLVYDFGGVSAALKASQQQTEAIRIESRIQQSETLLALIRSYLEWVRASYRLQLSQGYVASRQQFLELVQARESIGGSSKADVIRAETKLVEARDELPFSFRSVDQARASLIELYGNIPQQPLIFQLPMLDEAAMSSASLSTSQLKVAAIEKTVKSAEEQLRAESSRLFGAIRLDGSYQNVKDPVFNTSESTRVQLTYQVDVFSGYAQTARIDQARFRLNELKAEKDRLKREQSRILSSALADHRSQQESTQSRIKLVRAAKRASDITRELFVFNRGSISDIFKAQEDYLSASRNLLDAMVNSQLSYYTLLHEGGLLLDRFELTL